MSSAECPSKRSKSEAASASCVILASVSGWAALRGERLLSLVMASLARPAATPWTATSSAPILH
eukprot:CAMPEP_0183428538 /NCGR_PEP_ID=MMETSP0370-20130417/44666_1 /TAXON_ID=268820 /ORGANISM="Peridinium aciculiferum, Strain PAER-2" /LENGTH=63 /DNA_ID=CAMNT_0025613337 /DNA_START=61 /DNA_END=252 /DNA_ORIENTATION=-